MKEILKNILNSFTTNADGYSSRKLTAFIIIICVVAVHIKWLTLGNLTQLEMVLTIDYSFIATLFGMTTWSSIKLNIDNKNKVDKPVEPIENTEEIENK